MMKKWGSAWNRIMIYYWESNSIIIKGSNIYFMRAIGGTGPNDPGTFGPIYPERSYLQMSTKGNNQRLLQFLSPRNELLPKMSV